MGRLYSKHIKMEHNRLVYLLEKHRQDACNKAEQNELESWYYSLDSNGLSLEEWISQAGGEDFLANELYADFQNRTRSKAILRPIWGTRFWIRSAAAFAGVVFLLGIGYRMLNESKNTGADTVSFSAPSDVNESRFYILPDSSRVLLHAGSQLSFDKGNEDARQLSLSGEAYFDVKHNPDKPFVIHTGQVTTTVLGTEFNIRAYPDQDHVTISVSRGKVRVENGSKLLGILTKNQEIRYDNKSLTAEERTTGEDATKAWEGAALEFESVSFRKITSHLNKRYGISIRFANPSLEGCPITATFKGTETLTEILDVITATRGATYKIEDNGKSIVVEGDGCMM